VTFFLQMLLAGLMTGGVYALVALGFVMVYKASGVFNLAQGELFMIGGLLCWTFIAELGIPLWLSLLIALAAAAILGILIERLTMRPLIGESPFTLIMMTLSLCLMITGIATLKWGGVTLGMFELIPAGSLRLGGLFLSQQLLGCFILAILGVLIFSLYFRYTKSGLGMRAVAEDHQVAQSAGIRVSSVFRLVWIIGAITATVGGILLGSINGVSIFMRLLGLKILPVVLLGGLDSIPGAVVAGLIVGALESLALGYLDPIIGEGFSQVFPFIILIFVLLVRPHGIFGLARIERI